MAQQNLIFTATVNAPGYHDTFRVFAADEAAALKRAVELACEPHTRTPYLAFRAGRGTVTVAPALMPTGYGQDGLPLNQIAAE